MVQYKLLVITDQTYVSDCVVLDAVKVVKDGYKELDPLIMTQASSDSLLLVESSSLDNVVTLCKAVEFTSNDMLANVTRALKPGGTILLLWASQAAPKQTCSLGAVVHALTKVSLHLSPDRR